MLLTLLCFTSFLAGLVDAVAGGGGLIQIPMMFLLLPGQLPATIFGTNKSAMMAGTVVALIRYLRQVSIPWKAAVPAAGCAAVGALLGARTVAYFDPELVRPIVLVLLVVVAIYTFLKKDLGSRSGVTRTPGAAAIIGSVIGVVLGFYDGFFGPGTGSFLIFAFVSLLGLEFLVASACAKLVNAFTNLTPVLYFGAHGHILFEYALPMAACNIAGSLVGTRLAFTRGNAFIRKLFLFVIVLVILRYGWDVLK